MQNETRSKSLRARARARAALAFVLLAGIFATASAAAQSLQTIAGGLVGDGATPANASLNFALDIALDASGNLYIADQNNHRVRKVTPAGVVTTYAGTGLSGSTGDGGPATAAKLNKPGGLAFDSAGNLYISERAGNRIRKVTPAGTISTVAGDGSSAILNGPINLAVAPNGTIYVTESAAHRVKKIVGGVVSPYAGIGTQGYSGDGGAATAAQFYFPGGLLVEPGGSVLIADEGNNMVRRVATNGTISSFASVEAPINFAYNAAGDLYVVNYCQVFTLSPAGVTTLIIGDPDCPISFGGDGGSQEYARFDNITAIAIAANGRMYINDYLNERVRVANAGLVTTLVGPGANGEGSAAVGARVSHPAGMAYDSAGNLYVTERFLNRIRKITPAGVISTYAGNGETGFSGDGGPATAASFDDPRGLAFDQAGNLLVADYANHRIRAISPGGTINTIAGTGNFGVLGDGGPATLADLGQPDQIAVNAAGDIYFGQSARLRRIRMGMISTVAGGGSGAGTLSGVQATTLKVGRPGQIGFDSAGNVYFTDSTYHHVRRIDPTGIITTVAGDGSVGSSGDGGAATLAKLTSPHGLVVFSNGDLVIADATARVRQVTAGTINTVAGTGTPGFNGDGPALTTMLDAVTVIARAPGGGIATAELSNSRVRKLDIGTPPQQPALTVSDASIVEGNSGSKTMSFTVSLSAASTSAVGFDIATGNDTATAGSDYVALSLTGQSIPAGQTSKSFNVTINGDTTFESDEYFNVGVSNVSGAIVVDANGVGTITNDDIPGGPVPTLSIGDVSVSEGNTGSKLATFTVSLSAASGAAVTYAIATANGTATAGSDYVASSLIGQSIAAGQTSKTFSVTINGDTAVEPNETFTVNVSNVSGATVLDGNATGTITNDDNVPGAPTSVSASISGSTVTVTFAAPGSDGGSPIQAYYVSGPPESSCTFTDTNSGSLSLTHVLTNVSPNQACTYRVVAYNAAGGGQFSAPSNAVTYVRPDLYITFPEVQEGNSGTRVVIFNFNLDRVSPNDVDFDVATEDMSATAGSDYVARSGVHVHIPAGAINATFEVTVKGDTTRELDELFSINLTNIVGAWVPSANRAWATILDDEAGGGNPPSLSINNVIVTEGNSGTKLATFTVSLSKAASVPVTVDVTTGNLGALAGSDFVTASATAFLLPAGTTSRTFAVTINGDTTPEDDETFAVYLGNASGATIAQQQGTGWISNDDGGDGLAGLSIGDVSISEGNSGTKLATFTLSLTAARPWPVTYNIVASDVSAAAGSDFVAARLVDQTIPAGQTSATFSVVINGDAAVEPNENFEVIVWNVMGAHTIDDTAIGTITNDDGGGGAGGATLSIGDMSIAEGNSLTKVLTFTVTLSAPQAVPVTFSASTANATAIAGSDYMAKSIPDNRIAAGQTSKTFTVSIIGDTAVEANETFVVNLGNPVGATIADGQAVGTISNDDGGSGSTPTLSIGDLSISEGNAGTKVATFTVNLSATSASVVSYDIATTNGTATAGSDYVASSLTGQSIAAGQASGTFSVTINGDTAVEANETFAVNVSNVSGASVSDGSATGTITNDDVAPLPTLSIGDVTIVEGNGTTPLAEFTVSLSAPSASDVTFNIATADGSATAGSDYVARALNGLSIPAGSTSLSLTVTINGDSTFEPNETFTVDVSGVVGATVADGSATGTILNDDSEAPLPTLSISDARVSEGDTLNVGIEFTVTLSEPTDHPVWFDFTSATGTANLADFESRSSRMFVATGESSAIFNFLVIPDTQVEADESFTVMVSNVDGATPIDAVATGTILNDDGIGPQPTLAVADFSVVEGNAGTKAAKFKVLLSAPAPADVSFRLSTDPTTAMPGTDYVSMNMVGTIPAGASSGEFAVTVNGDTEAETDEYMVVNLSQIVGALRNDDQAYGFILDDDGNVGDSGLPVLSVGDISISEGNSGTRLATFTASLTKATTAIVYFSAGTEDGTAAAGSDYVASRLIGLTIPAGQTSKTFSVTINGDAAVESDETLFVNVWNVYAAYVGDGTGKGTITNDDSVVTPLPTLSIGDVSVSEGNSGTKLATFTVSLSAASASAVAFDIATANGSATAGSDFVASSLIGQSIAAGQTSKTFAVTINGDATVEPNEVFTVNLSNPVGATNADGQAVGTITNDDTAPVLPNLSIGDVSIAEGNAGTKVATFTVSLSAASASAVTYDIATANATATAGSDYVAASLIGQSIAAGQTSKTFAVTINGDTTVEPNETFTVNVSNVGGASIADGSATGTITNDDAAGGPTLSIGDMSIAEGNSLTKVLTFTVTLSAPQSSAVTFGASTANGTAVAGSDYMTKNIPDSRIAAGQTSKTFTVSIIGDTAVEPNETFVVNLSNPVGATIADGQAVGTITNDDAATLMAARFSAGGLVDDIDDGNHALQLSTNEYALLLADTARQLCTRTGAATLIGIDGVENRAVLADLADAANLTCVGTPRYQAVMADQGSIGFLVEAASDTDARGVQVIAAPTLDAKAGVAELTVQASGHARPITLLLPQALPTDAKARSAQLLALGQRVAATLKADPQARLVLIGGVTLNALLDLSARDVAKLKGQALPAERILLSPALQRQFGRSTVEYLPATAKDAAAQILHLQQ